MSIAIGKIFSFGPDCSPGNCVSSPVAATLSGVTVAITGTYNAVLQIESSTDNGASWIYVDNIVSAEVTRSYLFANIASGLVTNFRVRGSSWVSGTANVDILPLPQDVSTSVSNFPESQTVDGSITTLQGNVADVYSPLQHITALDTQSTSTIVANNAQRIMGTPTPGSVANFVLASGYTTMRFLVSGTWIGQLQSEMSMDDGATWFIQGLHQTGSAGEFAVWTGNFSAVGVGCAFTNVRLRATVGWSGTANIKLIQSINPAMIFLGSAIRIKDATTQTVQGAIKPASTPAVATDNALVVAVSPNNVIPVSATALPLPAGASTSALQTTGNASVASIDTKTPTIGQKAMAASSPVVVASDQSTIPVQEVAADLAVTATGIAGAAVTATLPAVASKNHYITMIEIVRYSAANVPNSATPVTVTTTNLPGNVAFTFATTQATGLSERQTWSPSKALKSAAAGVATTIACPATANVIWRVNVWYTAA